MTLYLKNATGGQQVNERYRDRPGACHTGESQHGGIIYDPVGTKDMTAKSLFHAHVHRLAEREGEIDLELAIKEGSSMGGLYMSLWVLKFAHWWAARE